MLKPIVLLVFIAPLAWAAPAPLTPTSAFFSSAKELYRSPLGFSIHAGKTQWTRVMPPKNNEYLNAIYRAPNEGASVQAALTVRSDELPKPIQLSAYAKQWLNDFPRLGFQVLTAKKVRVNGDIAFLIDMVNREAEKQLRQVVFLKARHAVTLTCRDDIKGFRASLKACNEIIRTFKW